MTSGDQKPGPDVFSILFEITQRMARGVPLEEALTEIARAAAEISGGDGCSVMLLDEERTALLSRATFGIPDEEAHLVRFRLGEGIAGWVATHDEPARVGDTASDDRFKALEGQTTRIRSICCVPLSTRDGVIGVITVHSAKKQAYTDEHERLLRFLAASIVKDVENARLYRLAVTDPLTRVYNRQWLFERLPAEVERHRRYGDPLALVMFDVDHFKKVNDTFGHQVGDDALKALAMAALEVVREVDGVVRYGGEEFLVVSPKTDAAGAAVVAERLRERVESVRIPAGDATVKITISLGVAELGPSDREAADLIARVDAALFEAKNAGRNRVVVAPAG